MLGGCRQMYVLISRRKRDMLIRLILQSDRYTVITAVHIAGSHSDVRCFGLTSAACTATCSWPICVDETTVWSGISETANVNELHAGSGLTHFRLILSQHFIRCGYLCYMS